MTKKVKDKDIAKYEKGFDDGYNVAKRLYKPVDKLKNKGRINK